MPNNLCSLQPFAAHHSCMLPYLINIISSVRAFLYYLQTNLETAFEFGNIRCSERRLLLECDMFSFSVHRPARASQLGGPLPECRIYSRRWNAAAVASSTVCRRLPRYGAAGCTRGRLALAASAGSRCGRTR